MPAPLHSALPLRQGFASDATTFRAIEWMGPGELEGIGAARKAARERAWKAGSPNP